MKHWAECGYKKWILNFRDINGMCDVCLLFAWSFKRTLNLLNTRKAFKASSKQSVLGQKIFRRF